MVGIARRSVLRGAAAVALLQFTVGGATAAPKASVGNGVGAVTRRSLEAAAGSAVRIVGGGGTVTGTLHHVNDLRHAAVGHPDAFAAVFHLDRDGAGVFEHGLVDVELPGLRLRDAGLLVTGDPHTHTAVLLVDRRPVSEHVTTPRV